MFSASINYFFRCISFTIFTDRFIKVYSIPLSVGTSYIIQMKSEPIATKFETFRSLELRKTFDSELQTTSAASSSLKCFRTLIVRIPENIIEQEVDINILTRPVR